MKAPQDLYVSTDLLYILGSGKNILIFLVFAGSLEEDPALQELSLGAGSQKPNDAFCYFTATATSTKPVNTHS